MKIIFAHLKPEIWLYKSAIALKNKKIKTILISLCNFDEKMYNGAFDEIISLKLDNLKPQSILKSFFKSPGNFFNFFFKLAGIKADAIISQGAPHYIAAAYIWLFKNRAKRIFFPYDFNFSKLDNPANYFPKREVWGEEYCFRNCDAIIVKSSIKELELVPFYSEIKKPVLIFPCYPLEKWFINNNLPKNKGIHVVYPGTVVFSPLVGSMTLTFQQIVKQKIHLHLYSLNRLTGKEISEITANGEFKNYLHVHPTVKPYELAREISRYNYGYHYSGHSNLVKREAVKYDVGNKIASYIEAGLPIIVKKEQEVTANLVTKNKIGIVLDNLQELSGKIKKSNYKSLVKNVIKMRKKYNVDNHAADLINFINMLKN